MSNQPPTDDAQRQMDQIRESVAINRAAIEALQNQWAEAHDRADTSQARADASEARADASEARADASEARADEADRRNQSQQTRAVTNHERIGRLEERVDIHEKMITELQADGLISVKHAAHLQEALTASRKIGAAIGIIMAYRKVGETDAFSVLVNASQNSNRKLRVVAADLVETGDVSQLPHL